MTTAQHTPGPWHIRDGSIIYGSRLGKNDVFEVADCKGYQMEREANARLIAAAPDMLAALRDCVEQMEQCAAMFQDDAEFMAALNRAREVLPC